MNKAFSPAPKSPSFCRLCAKLSAISFSFHSACRQSRLSQTQNSHRWCESLIWCCCLPLLMAGLAHRFGWPTLRVPCRLHGRGCLQAAHFLPHSEGCTEWPNIHTQKYVIMEMLDCVWGEFCWFVSQNLYFACLCVRFQKQLGRIHECFCLFSHCVDFLFQELFFLSINNNKEDGQGLQCRWSARMILSSCVNRFRVWWNEQSLGNISSSSRPISGSAAAAYV